MSKIQLTEHKVLRVENVRKTCQNKLRCLTNGDKDCDCAIRVISYTFTERKTIQEVSAHYIDDACLGCVSRHYCNKNGHVMKFKGTSGRNGQWRHAMGIKKDAYPLYQYLVFCEDYSGGCR